MIACRFQGPLKSAIEELAASINFPLTKLYEIVEKGYLCHWGEEEGTFAVTNPKQFAADVLPKYELLVLFCEYLGLWGGG